MDSIRICPRCRRGNPADASVCSDCGSVIDHVRATVPPLEPAMKVDPRGGTHPVHCPICGVPLEAGDASIHVNGWLWDWSALTTRLVFRRRGRREKLRVVEYGETRLAARCPSCRGVWIGPHPAPGT